MIRQIKIYDLDGTIICSNHRYRTNNNSIDLQYWRNNCTPEQINKDSLLPLAEAYKADFFNKSVYLIIATARECVPGDANYIFIEKHLGVPDIFIHRGIDDNRGGAELKINAIKPLLNLKQFSEASIHVFEDNIDYLTKMCKELKAHGHYIKSEQGY